MDDETRVTLRIPADVYRAVQRRAHAESRSLNGEIVWLLRQELARRQEASRMAEQAEQTERENALIVTLCREAGDTEPDAELVSGFRSNHHPDDIRAAASGDVAALVQLRQACGLPTFR